MSSDNLQEAARKGDLSAIADLVKQEFTSHEVHVKAEMLLGKILWIKLNDSKCNAFSSRNSINIVAKALDGIKPERITAVRVSGISPQNSSQQVWDKYLALQQDRFIDRTKETNLIVIILFGLVVFGVLRNTMWKPNPTSTASSTPVVTIHSTAPVQATISDQEVQSILSEITQKYGFSHFVDTWGLGTKGLFLPETAWNQLSPSQRNVLINYAQSKNFKAIIIGAQLAPNNIALDRTVWGD
jgi:hypothetical protein